MAPRALLSVFDKTGIVGLATALTGLGWEVVSSGGTANALAASGVAVVDVSALTGAGPMLGHRVVTLHPKVHGAILADLDDPEHRADLAREGLEPFALVVVNLYPFSDRPGIEMIDVGGPAMVRAAAKNHAHVGVVVDPVDYQPVLDELRAAGVLSSLTRRSLARKAFAHTAAYDAAIVSWLDEGEPLAPTLHLSLERAQELRYGENPHQRGARYRSIGRSSWWDGARQHGGKELSYLNVYDTEAAWRLVHRLGSRPAAVIVKHANPCGVAVGETLTDAYRAANDCDPLSAFGGIVALNGPVPRALAEALAPVFTEVVVAPSFAPDALDVLATKKNLRVLSAPPPGVPGLELRTIDGGFLVQEPDLVSLDRTTWRVVTTTPIEDASWPDIELLWAVCASVSSNAIVIGADGRALGIGAGQQNRVDSARIAVEKAAGRARGGVAASDGFFPFRDGLDMVASAGVRVVVQPGGSVRDPEVIAAADEHGIAMVFTDQRHFRH